MKITPGPLEGLLIIQPDVWTDSRGYFIQSFQQETYSSLGIPPFVQDNMSRSLQNVIRGLHYQLPHAQGKLVWVSRGKLWDVVVDLRKSSKTFGQWFGIELSDENHTQFYIPPGFAHGFCTLTEVNFFYKCTDTYSPHDEQGIAWNDQQLKIPWPILHPILSPKDEHYPALADVPHEKLFS